MRLNSGQRAALAAELMPRLKKEAKDRQRINALNNSPFVDDSNPQKIADSSQGDSRDKAANLMNTNKTYVDQAAKLKEAKIAANGSKTDHIQ